MPTQRNYSSVAQQTTITTALTNSVTTVPVASLTGYPAAPFCAAIDYGGAAEELVLVTNISGLNLTVTRGFSGSTAVAHSNGAIFQHVHVSQDFTDYSQHLFASTGVHGITGAVVGTTDAQTLSNKTLVSPTLTGAMASAIDDTNGNPAIGITATPAAVNDITVANAATGGTPSITAGGTDANVSLNLASKGTGTVKANGVTVADLTSAQALTHKDLSDASNTLPSSVVTLTGTQTLTNKTLTGPRVDAIEDSNGNSGITLTPVVAGSTNHIAVKAAAAGGGVPSIAAVGFDPSVSLDIETQGSGTLTVNGQAVVDVVNIQEVQNKILGPTTMIGVGNPDVTAGWVAYTPTVTASGGNPSTPSTAVGSYMRVGKIVHFRFRVDWTGTPSNGSGNYSFSLPFTTASSFTSGDAVGHGLGYQNSTTLLQVTATASAGSTTCSLYAVGPSSSGPVSNTLGNASALWSYRVSGTYESA